MADVLVSRLLRPAELFGLKGTRQRSWVQEPTSYERSKRALDLTVTLAALLLLSPVLLVFAVLIMIETRASVLVVEQCTGQGGRPFPRYRFRTTRCSRRNLGTQDSSSGGTESAAKVTRAEVTVVGSWLRRMRLDGLPQLLNVVSGEMSLVGPRPTCHEFDIKPLWYTARFDVRPGLVSAALASGVTSLEGVDGLRVDIAYIQTRAIRLDLQILMQACRLALRSGRYLIKRMLDLLVVSVLIVALSPFVFGIAALVRITSPGPVLFRQKRVGRNGIPFEILKFRTMREDAELMLKEDPGLYRRYVENDYKLPLNEDPRIFPLGRWLRRTSLDELPQLLNVLRGDMSLVGPRPVVPAELEHYQERASILLSVLPGLTGAWQVSGRSCIRYPERCEVELSYVSRWSLRYDMLILARTVTTTISGRGAT